MSAKVFFVFTILIGCGSNQVFSDHSEFGRLNHRSNYVDGTSKSELNLESALEAFHWKYFATRDFGLRSDSYGDGAFGAVRRGTPSHAGVDFLMPVGTQIVAPCSGIYLAGFEKSFGNWTQLICFMPSPSGDGPNLYASMIFAHLSSRAKSDGNTWRNIKIGETIGKSGQTGNAAGTNPHLHFDMVLHKTLAAAKNELHGSMKPTPSQTSAFAADFQKSCTAKYGFSFLKNGQLIRGDRIDPFAFFSCYSSGKPSLSVPTSQKLLSWSMFYKAKNYDVDVGQ